MSLSGLRTAVGGDRGVATARTQTVAVDGSLDGFAEGFARAYVAPPSADPSGRERGLKAYGFVDGASAPANVDGIRVRWSAVVASQARPGGGRTVTVLLDDGRRSWFLAVPVTVDRAGRRSVPSPPALVGPPAVRSDPVSSAELEVDDAELRQVVQRVVRHYLAGDRVDLAADLARGAVITVPPTPTRLADVDATTWVTRPSRVAVAISASGPEGVRLALRYELRVVRAGGRWLVRGIQVNPLDREQQP
ncbi:MAG TPA: hypothetical protein VFG42_11460 [Baekduia sp.]|uniref:hypothetical protein n=1 Tax=Baekduia sp. TaxID=2600305 RepID=UPI002D7726E4|nr:hypothetical protein [Baekduia sp.]HET6507395.1 hypothetical protein [Baekduia sp.]